MKPFIEKHLKSLSILSIISGILYSSWPLGHWLNPEVSRNSLASGLEAIGQPFNWVFIGGDISSSLIIVIICLLLWQKIKVSKSQKFISIALLCTVVFGIGTIIDATLPLRCVQGVETCPSFTTDHLLLAHGIFSILASVFLFIGLLILWFKIKRNVLLNVFLFGYILFGLISLIQAVAPGKNGNWSQDYYITLCSVWIAIIPYIIYQVLNQQTENKSL